MTHPVRTALVGFGYAGRTFHAPLIAACPDLRLEAVVSRQAETVSELWPDARVLTSFDQALADPAIDLIVLATPNDLHATQAGAALNAGKAVVVDKPFTLTAAEARRLATLAEERGLLLSVFHNRRWDADFLTLQTLIAEDRLGPVVRFESSFNRWRPEVRDRWREGAGPGAGLWYDLGPHLIDQALCLFGRPLAISCDLAILRAGGRAIDYAHAVLRYADKRVILHADMVTPAADARFAVHGARASWLKDGLDVQEDQLKSGLTPGAAGWGVDPRPGVVVDGVTGAREAVAGPPGDYPAYYSAVAGAVRDGAPNPVSSQEAAAVMEVLEAGLVSAERRTEVAL
ncbi:oxidoreductase [Brevundimonas pondensis]|uniref:Oxidoreductase n=1 Tax=Brevundimonas pondensis TaxID=2774189 RepID=A0ABX7SJZ1_9CAUL|nr:oxidoreductase [Brevundimonas pondensis]QTC87338.1 oxidoreductase [Brevundimonas pondensis]